MATNSTVNQSADDGIPLDFLAEMHVAMDCLPVDEEEANRLLQKQREHHQQQQRERVQRFNDAWNIQPIAAPDATPRITVATNLGINGRQELGSVRDPRLIAKAKTSTSQQAGSSMLPPPVAGASGSQSGGHLYHNPLNSTMPLQLVQQYQHNVLSGFRGKMEPGHSTYPENEDDDVVFQPNGQEELQHRTGRERSRSPASRKPSSGQHTSRARARSGHRSTRRHSRSPSRSPPHRRRKKRARSRSRHRSRSYSRSRSNSPSSEHSSGTEDSRGRTRRNRQPSGVDQTAMMQSMMSMVMQMVNGGMLMANGVQLPTATPAAGIAPTGKQPLTPAAFRNMFASRPFSAGQSMEDVINISDSSAAAEQGEDTRPKYDVSTELFLEGKLSFTDFLALKPSARSDLIAPVDPKVPKRINEAISVLDRHDTKKQSSRFLYVPPTYYETEKPPELQKRSPLIWNNQNVLFESTSRSKEIKQCQPFSNLNQKLRELTEKLGLDEGVVSQQLEQVKQAAALQKDGVGPNRSASGPTGATSSSSTSIQAITVVPPKPGTGKVRHLIEREAQTDGYACMDCVARKNKTLVTSATQTVAPPLRKDADVQTSGPPLSGPKVLSLDGLTANQIETIEAIVHFVRSRQIAGSIESVQHALRNDRVTAVGMTSTVQQNAQRLLSEVKADLQRTGTFPGGAVSSTHSNRHHSGNHRNQQNNHHSSTSIAQYTSYEPAALPVPPISHLYEQQLTNLRMGNRRGSGITRTFHTTSVSEQIFPACYDSQPQMSRKTKKKVKQQQQQQQQQQHFQDSPYGRW